MSQISNKKTAVQRIKILPEQAGRRIDNYLLGQYKDLPRTRVYQMLRKGEIRVNGGRVKQVYRLEEGDELRIPPMLIGPPKRAEQPRDYLIEAVIKSIIYEDQHLIVLNKPGGLVVHSGSGRTFGIIEILRHIRANDDSLQLAHRLDRETSGCLLIAKGQKVLSQLNKIFSEGQAEKYYTALLVGRLDSPSLDVDVPLSRNVNRGGERMSGVSATGKQARTRLKLVQQFSDASLVDIRLFTGRTHQIRVHAAHMGHPVAGDDKYGNKEFNKSMRKKGLKRFFLHASRINIPCPWANEDLKLTASLPPDLDQILQGMK